MILPFVGCMALKVLFDTPPDGIEIGGARIYAVIDMPLQPLYLTEATAVSAAVVLCLLFLSLFLTRKLSVRNPSKRQLLAEWIVEKCGGLVRDNMGERFAGFAPFVAAVMGISAFSSLSSLLGLYAPTSDLSIIGGWAIVCFALITHYKLKGGVGNYLKSYTEPIVLFTPMNVISEFATPVSMSLRHYGNVMSGGVISTLLASALGGLSHVVLGSLPGVLSQIPLFRVGIPAVLSLYFDIFSGLIQAYIFALLTMMYVTNGFPEEKYEARMAKKRARLAEKKKTSAES